MSKIKQLRQSSWRREEKMSNLTSASGETCVTSSPQFSSLVSQSPKRAKKKRGLPGNPDPDAEVIALSPKTLMTTNRFVCDVCNKGFQRDQNLQLHRRGHNLPWKLKQRVNKDQAARKKVYVCPEVSCVHHDPSRALGDLTGIKKHFSRKHGEKKWKCDKCSKKRDSFITHRAFCDALADETTRVITPVADDPHQQLFNSQAMPSHELPEAFQTDMIMKPQEAANTASSSEMFLAEYRHKSQMELFPSINQHKSHPPFPATSAFLSATALLQKACQMGAIMGRAHQHLDQMAGFSRGFASRQGPINWSDNNLHGLMGTRSADALDHELVCEGGQGSEGKSTDQLGRGRGDSNQLTLDLLGKRAILQLDPSMNNFPSYEDALQEPYWNQ
ncbi:hypothetical protein ZIOFF_007336 [Zingiber officinale]|uniref:C2H2-type domain-containing protein n=1 Tax=Zingiber officinale TaxID=94328 RepID=A0A8J5I191_ZINOF|nr:hypothetical protein ZIOFF_007336 [Zingiber officinale]